MIVFLHFMLDDLFEAALRDKREVCVKVDERTLKEIMELVKRGELKPTVLANPLRGKVSLVKPLPKGRLHVVVDEEKVCVHYDEEDPARNPIGHLLKDTEFKYILLTAAISALIALIKKLRRQKGRG